jgi:uncharacterized membrane protein
MEPKQNIQPDPDDEKIEAVVGVFPTHVAASRVAASLRGPDVKVQKISRLDPATPDAMPEIVYDEIEELSPDNVVNGAMLGGAIGGGSGLLFLAIPGLNVAAPIAGMLAGAWIGAVAGVDEAARAIELPNSEDYQSMLAEGKSFVVVAGDENKRFEFGKRLKELGAETIYQHPPLAHVVR